MLLTGKESQGVRWVGLVQNTIGIFFVGYQDIKLRFIDINETLTKFDKIINFSCVKGFLVTTHGLIHYCMVHPLQMQWNSSLNLLPAIQLTFHLLLQIEFYFGNVNLQHDSFLMKKIRNDKDGCEYVIFCPTSILV